MSRFTLSHAIAAINESELNYTELFTHGSLTIELYAPETIDDQEPHDQDEVYIIAAGSGTFVNDGVSTEFQPGDVLFVPAEVEHRFENFTEDFSTWVIFYGPEGGERA